MKTKHVLLIISLFFCQFAQPQTNDKNVDFNMTEWKLINMTDDFGRPTEDTVAIIYFEGTFSNSATSGSPLLGSIKIGKNKAFLDLFQYGKPHNRVNFTRINIQVLDENGVIHTAGSPYPYFNKTGSSKLVNILLKNGALSFIAKPQVSGRYGDEYRFIINATGLSKILHKATF